VVALGVMMPYAEGLVTSGDFLRDFAGTLESCGVESVWAVEHVIVAEDYEPLYPYSDEGRMASAAGSVPMTDPLETLAFVAAASTTLVLGTAVIVAPLHSPAVLAKRAATLDRLSGGRLRLGLGIGWQREEYAAVGVPYADRGRRLDECIGAMRALWASAPASYDGRYVSFDRVHCLPRPAASRIPIVLGGHSAAAVLRAARVADGWFPFTISAEDFEVATETLSREMTAMGRNRDQLELTAWPGSHDPSRELDPKWVRRFVDAGASRLIVRTGISHPGDLPRLRGQIERYQTAVLDQL
jgi:probable F420-dependent oxidoreductase